MSGIKAPIFLHGWVGWWGGGGVVGGGGVGGVGVGGDGVGGGGWGD